MHTLVVETESHAAAKLLLAFLKTVRLVKSITLSPNTDTAAAIGTHVVHEPAGAYNWINPSRPATDEEIDAMLDECEAQIKSGNVLSIHEAEEKTSKKNAV